MRQSILLAVALALLAGAAAVTISGCGGSGATAPGEISGVVLTISATRAPGDAEYVPVPDCAVYALNLQTRERVCAEVRTNARGQYALYDVPDDVDVELVAEKDTLQLRTQLRIQDRLRTRECDITPDTTVAASAAVQLQERNCTEEQIREMHELCLQYQAENPLGETCTGGGCDVSDPVQLRLTARECVQATANERIGLSLQTRTQERCQDMVTAGVCDAIVNCDCPLRLTEQQRTRLAERACDGGVWTEAEAAGLLAQAGITRDDGSPVTEADVVQARTRLRTRLEALVQERICAAEMIMLCCQNSDTEVPFRARTQQQLDSLVDLVAPE